MNQEILRNAGAIRRLDRPMKVLGGGELSTALFVVADAFTKSAREKIEAAGGTAQLLELPATPLAAVTGAPVAAPEGAPEPAPTGTGASEPAVAEPAVAAEPPADDAEAKAEAAQVEGATEEVAEAAADDDAETGA